MPIKTVVPVDCEVRAADASKFWEWVHMRGGVAVWRSVNLSNPGASWSTPAKQEDGSPMPKPSWQSDDKPEKVVTDPSRIKVYTGRKVKTIRIGIQRGSGLSFVLTDSATRRLREAMREVGEEAYYTFDFDERERRIAVIWLPVDAGRLDAYALAEGWEVPGGGAGPVVIKEYALHREPRCQKHQCRKIPGTCT
jgi:hypothetical protein